jgi:hypothetical protein
VDATDTEMLNDPFVDLEPGRLHVGSEPWTWGSQRLFLWTRSATPSMVGWAGEHAEDTVLNCGLVGGDAPMVRDMYRMLGEAENDDLADMGVRWRIMYDQYPNWVTGHPVHTVFLQNDRSTAGGAWWRHK